LTVSGEPQPPCDSPKRFLTELREAMSKAPTIEALFAVWEHNLDNVRLINKHLRSTARKDTSAQDLVAHLRSCAVALAVQQCGRSRHTTP
jgi:hypothetical protein